MDLDAITAIHEAAHAVVALRLDLVFDHVSSIPDEERQTDGALHWTDLHGSGELAIDPESIAIVLIAGPCAEARFRKLRVDRVFMGEAALDDRMSLAELGLSEDEFVAATRAAIDNVDAHWNAIERVAAVLVERGRLTFEEVAVLAD
jgi:hypothetical protein